VGWTTGVRTRYRQELPADWLWNPPNGKEESLRCRVPNPGLQPIASYFVGICLISASETFCIEIESKCDMHTKQEMDWGSVGKSSCAVVCHIPNLNRNVQWACYLYVGIALCPSSSYVSRFITSPWARLPIGVSSWVEWHRRWSEPLSHNTNHHSVPLENVTSWWSIKHRPQFSRTLFRVLTAHVTGSWVP
jgi:hypothetical protein